MRRTRTREKFIKRSHSTPNRFKGCRKLQLRPRNVWVVSDDGHPKSPLSIERLPQNVKRNTSKVAHVKPTCQAMVRRRNATSKDLFPFFIDKSPCEEVNAAEPRKGQPNMNESVVILDSPCVSSVARELEDTVDTVDLCSENEEERTAVVRSMKRKKRNEIKFSKRRKLSIKSADNDQPDIIVLDDDEQCTSKPCQSSNSEAAGSKEDLLHAKSKFSGVQLGNSSSIDASSSSAPKANACLLNRWYTDTRATNQNTCLATSKSASCQQNVPLFGNVPGPSRGTFSDSNSRNCTEVDTVGSNVFNPYGNMQQTGLRPIIIDGCNVAIAHGGNRMFSVKGLCICVEYFLRRGHPQVVALVPLHQRSKVSPQDRDILESLRNDGHLVYTPSRFIDNRLISSYDDRFIVQYAAAVGGVIVSRDNYRDLLNENLAWRETITQRLLMPTWVGDMLMFPVDPLGKMGPSLDVFLRFPNT